MTCIRIVAHATYAPLLWWPPTGGTRDAIVKNSVRTSKSWHQFRCLALEANHRQHRDYGYARWVLDIGNGIAPASHKLFDERGYIALDLCSRVHSEQTSLDFCFPALNDPLDCVDKKILCPTNAAVNAFNDLILDKLTQVYLLPQYVRQSADSIEYDGDHDTLQSHVTAEFLNMQNENGVPPHELRLVQGALYQLMRNFSMPDQLMNHTHVILSGVAEHHVIIETLDGRQFPLPRICFRWPLAKGTTNIIRRQYPLRLAYASTFNGVQGSTLTRCVLDSRSSPFSHGQLYVALSRVRWPFANNATWIPNKVQKQFPPQNCPV